MRLRPFTAFSAIWRQELVDDAGKALSGLLWRNEEIPKRGNSSDFDFAISPLIPLARKRLHERPY